MAGLGPYAEPSEAAASVEGTWRTQMDMEGILAITLIFGGGTLFLLSISPVGRALAERIRGNAEPAQDPELLSEVDALRQEVAELHERVDFAERVLMNSQERKEIGKGETAG
jgi:hypothetical protein